MKNDLSPVCVVTHPGLAGPVPGRSVGNKGIASLPIVLNTAKIIIKINRNKQIRNVLLRIKVVPTDFQ
jgi:hypothetical protein